MGKFDGMLLVSDFDNTLVYTEEALSSGTGCFAMYPRNLEAIRYWMAEGGVFAVATGRSLAGYRRPAAGVPTNAPAIVDNGGSIYDFRTEQFLYTSFLPPCALEQIAAVMEAFPTVSLEMCHDGDLVQVMRPTDWNDRHAALTGAGYEVVEELTPAVVPLPLAKAMFVEERTVLEQVREFLLRRGWGENYELIFSHARLLELTARGANKGAAVERLRQLCGCGKLYCAGDQLNDLPMLQAADRAFCPANAVEEILRSGAEVVCHCREGAIGEIIARLEQAGD